MEISHPSKFWDIFQLKQITTLVSRDMRIVDRFKTSTRKSQNIGLRYFEVLSDLVNFIN